MIPGFIQEGHHLRICVADLLVVLLMTDLLQLSDECDVMIVLEIGNMSLP